MSTIWIKLPNWLKIRSGCGILIYSAGQGLRVLDTLARFSAISVRGDNFCDLLFALLYPNPIASDKELFSSEKIWAQLFKTMSLVNDLLKFTSSDTQIC